MKKKIKKKRKLLLGLEERIQSANTTNKMLRATNDGQMAQRKLNAVHIIQGRIRIHRFKGLGLTPTAIATLPFGDVLQKLKNESTVKAARAVIGKMINPKVFLTSFMVAVRPTEVFDEMGVLEQALFDSAVPLVRVFSEAIANARFPPDFRQLVDAYALSFAAWKVSDELKVVQRIRHALNALYNVNDGTNPLVMTQIAEIRERMIRVAGREALRAFDVERMHNGGLPHANLLNKLTQEMLGHEVLLDPAYRVSTPETGVFVETFWAALCNELKREPQLAYGRFLNVMTELAKYTQTIDVDAIRMRTDAGTFTLVDCCELLAGFDILCEPAAESVCDGMRRMVNTVNTRNVLLANAKLAQIAPTIAEHGVAYEINKFRSKFQNGELTIVRTRAMVNATLNAAPVELRDGSPLSMRKLLATAVVAIISDPSAAIPETLELDTRNIAALRDEFIAFVNTKTILAIVAARGLEMGADGEVPEQVRREVAMADDIRAIFRRRIGAFLVNCLVHGVADTSDIYQRGVSKERADRFVNRFYRIMEINQLVHGGTYEHLWLEFIGYLTPV